MHGKGQSNLITPAFLLIIALFAMIVVLRIGDPFHRPEVKALQFSDSISSLINSLSLSEEGKAEIRLKDAYDVNILFEHGRHIVRVSNKKTKGPKESPILFYPAARNDALLKSFTSVEKICIRKVRGKSFAEVEEC